MLSWVVEQHGQEAMKDPDLAKQVTLAVLRSTIPNPKVPLVPAHAASVVAVGDMSCGPTTLCHGNLTSRQIFCHVAWELHVLGSSTWSWLSGNAAWYLLGVGFDEPDLIPSWPCRR